MTGKQIKEDALLYAAIGGYNIQDPIAVGYINRAIDIIMRDYDEVGVVSTENYTITNATVNVWQSLPSDFLVARRIYYNDTSSQTYVEVEGYVIQNGQIRFGTYGTFTMEYVPVPTYMSNIDREPSINVMWHPAISYYVAYRAKAEVFGDEEGEKNELYARFEEYCRKVSSRLNRRKPRRTMKAPLWG